MTGENTEHGWIDSETKIAEAPDNYSDDVRLWLRLLTCSTLVESDLRRLLREEFGTTLPRFDLLAQLERVKEGILLGELSKRMMVSPGNLTSLVDRLVESGHVTRRTSALDRRAQVITMTDFGHADFRRMAERHGEWVGALFEGLTAGDRSSLMTELEKLKRSIRMRLTTNGHRDSTS